MSWTRSKDSAWISPKLGARGPGRLEGERTGRAQASSRSGASRRWPEPARGPSTWDPALTMLLAVLVGVALIGVMLIFAVHLLDYLQSTLANIHS